MQPLERFFKVYFDGRGHNLKYYIEEKNINTESSSIILLTQGHIRSLNLIYEQKIATMLHDVMRRILVLSIENQKLIEDEFRNSDFNIVDFLINREKQDYKTDNIFLGPFFNNFIETKNVHEVTTNVYIKYEINMGMVFQKISLHLNDLIIFQTYIIMLKHLLPRLPNAKAFFFFIFYIFYIENEIDENKNKNRRSPFWMASILKNASNNFLVFLDKWTMHDDGDSSGYVETLRVFCVPEL